MLKLTEIIARMIIFPFTVIKWLFYFILTCILLFGIGFIIDKYVGWNPVIKPVRDSAVTITVGIIKKTTPYLQNFAAKFGESSSSAELSKQTKGLEVGGGNSLDAEGVMESIEQAEGRNTLKNLTEDIATSLQKDTDQQTKVIASLKEEIASLKKDTDQQTKDIASLKEEIASLKKDTDQQTKATSVKKATAPVYKKINKGR